MHMNSKKKHICQTSLKGEDEIKFDNVLISMR